MMLTLHVVRGLPGSGKSTLAQQLAEAVFEIDDFFTSRLGAYVYREDQVDAAAEQCLHRTISEMSRRRRSVAVANSFSRHWEYKRYALEARRDGYRVQVHDLFDAGLTDEQLCDRCVHNVPLSYIKRMRGRWQRGSKDW